MSSKISALAVATTALNADLLTSVQAGVNKSVTRPVLLQAVSGEAISLVGDSAHNFFLLSGGAAGAEFVRGQGFGIADTLGFLYFEVLTSGEVILTPQLGNDISLNNNGLILRLPAGGPMALTDISGNSIVVQYKTANNAWWAGSPPTDVAAAIDRIAAVVSIGGTTPIP